MSLLKQAIAFEEGFKSRPYHCTGAKFTIGRGRNYQDNPWTPEEMKYLGFPRSWEERPMTPVEASVILDGDIARWVLPTARAVFGLQWNQIGEVRQAALGCLIYQVGAAGFRRFEKMIKAVKAERWVKAHAEMMDSEVARNKHTHARTLRTAIALGAGDAPAEWVNQEV